MPKIVKVKAHIRKNKDGTKSKVKTHYRFTGESFQSKESLDLQKINTLQNDIDDLNSELIYSVGQKERLGNEISEMISNGVSNDRILKKEHKLDDLSDNIMITDIVLGNKRKELLNLIKKYK